MIYEEGSIAQCDEGREVKWRGVFIGVTERVTAHVVPDQATDAKSQGRRVRREKLMQRRQSLVDDDATRG